MGVLIKSFVVLILMTLSLSAYSEVLKKISRVEIICNQTEMQCSTIYNKFEDFIGQSFTERSIRERIKFKLIDHPFEYFNYKVFEESEGLVLEIKAAQKKTIRRIDVRYNAAVNLPSAATYLPIREGDYFDDNRKKKVEEILVKFLGDRGFVSPQIDFRIEERAAGTSIDLTIDVKLQGLTRVEDVLISTSNPRLLGRVRQKFRGFRGQILDRLQFKLAVDQLSRELFESGFYDSEVTVLPEELSDNGNVLLRVQVNYGSLHSFHFKGNHHLGRSDILEVINTSIKQNLSSMNSDELKVALVQAYRERGHYNVKIDVREVRGKNRNELDYVNYFFNINEGQKIKLSQITFTGNINISDVELIKLYKKEGSVLAKRGFLDEEYLETYRNLLTKMYLSKGYVLIEVSAPVVTFKEKNEAEVKFTLRERQRATLTSINIENIEESLANDIKKTLMNKERKPLDVTTLEQDLQQIEVYLHQHGHYFAEIANIDDEELLVYSANFTEASLHAELVNHQKTLLNSVIVTGFDKTKNIVLSREIELVEGDLITPERVERLRDSLVSLDLFASVRVTPYIVEEKSNDEVFYVNLVVQVVEKAFGVIEIAPGYRTDLGAKISLGVNYNNIQGMNRSATLKVEANRRFDYSDFDTRRREEKRQVLEYNLRANYTEPYLFPKMIPTKIQFDSGVSFQRKRFVSFDADILRVSPQISKTFWDRLTLSLKYQFETIKQFDATNEDFNDKFTIGSITPAAILDLRNDAVRPTKGAYFGLNWEFANPYFLSMDDDEIEVNYYRLTSRNNFYFPLSRDLVLAVSLAGGIQKNFANEAKVDDQGNPLRDDSGRIIRRGFIPSTKVFRLDGIDTVRGFSGEEINRLIAGRNIGEVVVDNLAYFVNFKFEPRYYVSDALAVGAFYDAGRVFVDSFEPLDLRSSVGATFKILTPVGSLDFDYGLKIKRERDDATGREAFGRFHLSIGFF